MITLLNRYLGIPLESLVAGNRQIKLDPEKREKLLNVLSIRKYITRNRREAII
jgi:HTH-type transcriptional regulator/antitoxin HigA